MTDRSNKISHLIIKYLQDTLNEQEQQELDSWIAESSENKLLFNQLTNAEYLIKELRLYNEFEMDGEKTPTETSEKIEPPKKYPSFKYMLKALLVAAAFVGIIWAGWQYLKKKDGSKSPPVTRIQPLDKALLKKNKVALALADNTVINLDAAKNGSLGRQGSSQVIKQGTSLIYYRDSSLSVPQALYNLVSTQRAAKFKVVLPDGSIAWLNDSSSIQFPVSFDEHERKVEITGEVYFEVKSQDNFPEKANKVPFIVTVIPPNGDTFQVEVLGTQFNIKAYADYGNIKATVLKGHIKVIKQGDSAREVRAGQSAEWKGSGPIRVYDDKNSDAAITWKDSILIFDEVPVSEVIRTIERCYDVHITFDPNSLKEANFTGKILTNQSLENVLATIQDQCGGLFKVNSKVQ